MITNLVRIQTRGSSVVLKLRPLLHMLRQETVFPGSFLNILATFTLRRSRPFRFSIFFSVLHDTIAFDMCHRPFVFSGCSVLLWCVQFFVFRRFGSKFVGSSRSADFWVHRTRQVPPFLKNLFEKFYIFGN